MSEVCISEEQFNKFHHWIRIASAKEHSEFHRELTKLGLQEQLWLKQIIVHSEVINNYEIVQDTVPPSPVLSNAPLPQAPLVLQQETPLFAPELKNVSLIATITKLKNCITVSILDWSLL